MTTVPLEFQAIYETGEALQRDICEHLNAWPKEIIKSMDDRTIERFFFANDIPPEFADQCTRLHDRTHIWINLFSRDVLPHTIHNKNDVYELLRRLNLAIDGQIIDSKSKITHIRRSTDAINVVIQAMEYALRLIRTASPPEVSGGLKNHPPTASYAPNTAFIMMSMDPNNPELEDVLTIVKRVFEKFDVMAIRADEIEHQDSITQVVLDEIKRAEFLFADLTYERPNVYYEVGYAHALGKRPILYRKTGTRLHFDLSVHNVPEYENMTRLESLLKKRLATVTGREPNQ
jgi:hypothetical protein